MDEEALRDKGIADAAADAVEPPTFPEIASRGAALVRRRRAFAGVVGAAAAVAVVTFGISVVSGGEDARTDVPAGTPSMLPSSVDSSPEPSPEPTAPKSEEGTDPAGPAKAMVEGPNSRLRSAAVAIDGSSAASLWACSADCHGVRQALLVVDGDEQMIIPVEEEGNLVDAGGGRFVFTSFEPGAQPQIISVDGVVAPDEVEEAPLAQGELLVQISGSGVPIVGLVGVDVEAGTMHPVPVPKDGILQTIRASGQSLTAVMFDDGGVRFSDDGGESWRSVAIDNADYLTNIVPSARADVRVLELGGDGATLFPFNRVVRIFEDGTFATNDQEGKTEYVVASFVRADGRLVSVLTSGERSEGGRNWQVSVREPLDDGGTVVESSQLDAAREVIGVSTGPDGPVLMMDTDDPAEVLISSDGEVWTSARIR